MFEDLYHLVTERAADYIGFAEKHKQLSAVVPAGETVITRRFTSVIYPAFGANLHEPDTGGGAVLFERDTPARGYNADVGLDKSRRAEISVVGSVHIEHLCARAAVELNEFLGQLKANAVPRAFVRHGLILDYGRTVVYKRFGRNALLGFALLRLRLRIILRRRRRGRVIVSLLHIRYLTAALLSVLRLSRIRSLTVRRLTVLLLSELRLSVLRLSVLRLPVLGLTVLRLSIRRLTIGLLPVIRLTVLLLSVRELSVRLLTVGYLPIALIVRWRRIDIIERILQLTDRAVQRIGNA